MMTNLFSIFDPSSSLFSFSWLLIFFLPLVFPNSLWKTGLPLGVMKSKILFSIHKEICFTMKKSAKGEGSFLIMIFVLILGMNFVALYPQVFSLTSHICVTLFVSLSFWLGVISFGWSKNTKHMLIHLVPQGTPSALTFLMVIIELTSNLIRPITLCVRLTANLIAGHLLMTLLGNFLMGLSCSFSFFVIFIPLILTVLESAVAFIQAYVFVTLVTLYITEVK